MTNHCKLITDTFEIQDDHKVYDFQKCLNFIEYQGKANYGHNFKINILDIPTIYKLVIYIIKDEKTALKEQIELNKGICYRIQLVVGKPPQYTSLNPVRVLYTIKKPKPAERFLLNLPKVVLMSSTNTH